MLPGYFKVTRLDICRPQYIRIKVQRLKRQKLNIGQVFILCHFLKIGFTHTITDDQKTIGLVLQDFRSSDDRLQVGVVGQATGVDYSEQFTQSM